MIDSNVDLTTDDGDGNVLAVRHCKQIRLLCTPFAGDGGYTRQLHSFRHVEKLFWTFLNVFKGKAAALHTLQAWGQAIASTAFLRCRGLDARQDHVL